MRYISLHFTWWIFEHERTKASAEERVFMVKLKGSLIHLIQVFLTFNDVGDGPNDVDNMMLIPFQQKNLINFFWIWHQHGRRAIVF